MSKALGDGIWGFQHIRRRNSDNGVTGSFSDLIPDCIFLKPIVLAMCGTIDFKVIPVPRRRDMDEIQSVRRLILVPI